MKILLRDSSNVTEFVKTTQSFESDINVIKGRYVLDAKSLLGILSLDLSKPVELEIISDDTKEKEELFNTLEPYLIH